MEALDSGGSGIDDKHIPFRVTHDLQYVRMPADEDVRPVLIDQFQGAWVISSGITSDMSHQNLHSLALEETVERVAEAEGVIVTIAGYSDQWLETGNLFSEIHSSTEVPRMPYLIYRCKKFLELSVE